MSTKPPYCRLAQIFRNMRRLGTTVLIATRDVGFARHLGEPALRLENGTLSAAPKHYDFADHDPGSISCVAAGPIAGWRPGPLACAVACRADGLCCRFGRHRSDPSRRDGARLGEPALGPPDGSGPGGSIGGADRDDRGYPAPDARHSLGASADPIGDEPPARTLAGLVGTARGAPGAAADRCRHRACRRSRYRGGFGTSWRLSYRRSVSTNTVRSFAGCAPAPVRCWRCSGRPLPAR